MSKSNHKSVFHQFSFVLTWNYFPIPYHWTNIHPHPPPIPTPARTNRQKHHNNPRPENRRHCLDIKTHPIDDTCGRYAVYIYIPGESNNVFVPDPYRFGDEWGWPTGG